MPDTQEEFVRSLPVVPQSFGEIVLPAKKATPFDWPAWRVDQEGVELRWSDSVKDAQEFRFTVAIDLRSAPLAELVLSRSGYRLGVCEVAYGCPLQTFHIALSPGMGEAIEREGVRFRAIGAEAEFWILAAGDKVPTMLAPHLFGGDRVRTKKVWECSMASLCSPASLQLFGWLEGCVLEGLSELALRLPQWREQAEASIECHLSYFFNDSSMVFVSPRSESMKGRWYNNEHGLMLPTLIRRRPEHPAVDLYKEQLLEIYESHLLRLERNLSCEGCYTIAYPLAMLSLRDNDRNLLKMALEVILQHQQYLKKGETLYLQYNYATESHIYPFWLRGIAWYLLGHARVLQIAALWQEKSEKVEKIRAELTEMIRVIQQLQAPNGLWSCFAGERETGNETSGSAGIAAAFLLAEELGCADQTSVAAAERTLRGLEAYLSKDGLLSGVSQSNKSEAGEALQRYGIRTRSQMGQGLAIQLAAILQARPMALPSTCGQK